MAASAEDMQGQMGAQAPDAGGAPPSGSPAAQPTGKEGAKQMGAVKVQTALLLLQGALAHFDLRSEEGQAVLDVLKKLSLKFGQPGAQELVPAEIMQLAKTAQTQGSAPTGPQ